MGLEAALFVHRTRLRSSSTRSRFLKYFNLKNLYKPALYDMCTVRAVFEETHIPQEGM